MRRPLPLRLIIILALALTLAGGCGLLKDGADLLDLQALSAGNASQVVSAGYHEHALYNFYVGRLYLAEGRYELARERFLFALSAARADETALRDRAVEELDIVDRLIAAQR